jgi:hypothetical protein
VTGTGMADKNKDNFEEQQQHSMAESGWSSYPRIPYPPQFCGLPKGKARPDGRRGYLQAPPHEQRVQA